MNIKQKMIEAMYEAFGRDIARPNFTNALDAALAVLADPANWTDDMKSAAKKPVCLYNGGRSFETRPQNSSETFAAVIKHIREMAG